MCFLFSSCNLFVDNCVDCVSGVLQCNVCHFQDTLPDGSCIACKRFWDRNTFDLCASVDCKNRFEDSCYLILNTTEQHNNAVNRWNNYDFTVWIFLVKNWLNLFQRSCRKECERRRGHMGSIHSEEENAFVLSLVWALSNISHHKIMHSLISIDAKVSSPWGAFLGLVWSGSQNIWEDGTAWDYQNFGQGHTPYITWICEICERNLAEKNYITKPSHRPNWIGQLLQAGVQPRRDVEQCSCREVLWHQEPAHGLFLQTTSLIIQKKGLTNILVLYHWAVFITPVGSRKRAVWTLSAAQKWPTSPQIFHEAGTKENEILFLIWGSMMLGCSIDRTQMLKISQKWMSLLSTKEILSRNEM